METIKVILGIILLVISVLLSARMIKEVKEKTFIMNDVIFIAIIIVFSYLGVALIFNNNLLP